MVAARKWEIYEGMSVRDLEGHKLGTVVELRGDGVRIEKGVFFPKEYVIDLSEVSEIRGDAVYLRRGKEEMLQIFEQGASANTNATLEPTGGFDADERLGERVDERVDTEARVGATRQGSFGRSEEVRVPVVEEELFATKRVERIGEVRVRKDVVSEHHEIDVPVVKEVVTVERVPASDATSASGEAAFRDEDITIPIREEQVDVSKRTVVR